MRLDERRRRFWQFGTVTVWLEREEAECGKDEARALHVFECPMMFSAMMERNDSGRSVLKWLFFIMGDQGGALGADLSRNTQGRPVAYQNLSELPDRQ